MKGKNVDETTTQAMAAQPDLGAISTTNGTDVTPANAHEAARAAANALLDADQPQPVQSQTPQAPVSTTETPESGQSEAETQSQPVETTAQTPEGNGEATTTTEDTTDEEEYSAQIPTQPIVPQLDSSKFIDENGLVDVRAMTDTFNQALAQAQYSASQTAQAEVNAQRLEERQWNQATEKFPQLKTDRALRDIVQQARVGKATELYQRAGNNPQALAAIKIPSPTQIASELFKRLGDAKSQGVREATENVRVQQNTTFQETASTPGDTSAPSKKAELFGKIRDVDPIKANAAQRDLLKEMLFEN